MNNITVIISNSSPMSQNMQNRYFVQSLVKMSTRLTAVKIPLKF